MARQEPRELQGSVLFIITTLAGTNEDPIRTTLIPSEGCLLSDLTTFY
jgi:hypothetical protein